MQLVRKPHVRVGACVLAISTTLFALSGCFFHNQEPPVVLPSDVYVDATSGDDAGGDGTHESPYRTISKALAVLYGTAGYTEADWYFPASWSPVTLHAAPGIYNRNHGEDERLLLSNISLVGQGASRNDVVVAVAISLLGDSSLRGITASGEVSLSQGYSPPFRGCSVLLENTSIDVLGRRTAAPMSELSTPALGASESWA